MKNIDWRNHPNRKELEDAYTTLSENCGIKVGDTVRILRAAENHELGWGGSWSTSKNLNVGKELIVMKSLSNLHVPHTDGFDIDGNYYPFFILEKVAEVAPVIVLTIDGKEVKISDETLENIRKEL